MIINSYKTGQLGNRLFAFSHLIAYAAATGKTVINTAFDEYAPYFETTNRDVWCRYPPKRSWIRSQSVRTALFFCTKVLIRLLRSAGWLQSPFHSLVIADLPEYRFDEPRHLALTSSAFQDQERPLTFLFGRFFRDYDNLQKYRALIQEYFVPREHIRKEVAKLVGDARTRSNLLVGVHVRRGDYREFVGGRYFYTGQQYLSKMVEVRDLFPDKNVSFIICSNERLQLPVDDTLNILPAPGHMVSDMYTLAACDLIMGPPSTFSLWASFVGNKPICQIRDVDRKIDNHCFIYLPPEEAYNFSFN